MMQFVGLRAGTEGRVGGGSAVDMLRRWWICCVGGGMNVGRTQAKRGERFTGRIGRSDWAQR